MYDNLYMYGYLSMEFQESQGGQRRPCAVPTILIRMHGRMVGTPPDAFASGASAHPTRL
jgi:hypothetical protein